MRQNVIISDKFAGAEGFAGSASQMAIMHYLAEKGLYRDPANRSESLPTVVLVHALNPYGMAHNRRVNEINVDLNRNFLKEKMFRDAISRDPNFAGYVTLDAAMNPTSFFSSYSLINDLYYVGEIVRHLIQYGLPFMKRALVSGNYFKPKGLGYGGEGWTRSAENLIYLLTQHLDIPAKASHVTLIDVHTGLGPSGVDSLGTYPEDVPSEHLEKYFPIEYYHNSSKPTGGLKSRLDSKDPSDALSGYDLTIGCVAPHFCEYFLQPSNGHLLCMTQEFGTIPSVLVGKALIEENLAHFYGTESQKEFYGKRLRDAFFVDTAKWRYQVARRGLDLFLQGLAYSIDEATPPNEKN